MDVDLTKKNTLVIIAHNYGILYYIDLICYMFRLNTAKYSTDSGKKYILYEGEDIAKLQASELKVVIICSTPYKIKNIVLQTAMEVTAALSKDKGYNNFELYEEERALPDWSISSLKEKIPKDASKILLSVPDDYETKLLTQITNYGYDSSLISYACT